MFRHGSCIVLAYCANRFMIKIERMANDDRFALAWTDVVARSML